MNGDHMVFRKLAAKGMSRCAKFQWCFFLLTSLALFFLHDGPLVIAGLFITQLSLQMSMTRTGKEVFGVIFNIQSWRNSGASQQTYFFRWYIGFPISCLLYILSLTNYVYVPGDLYYQFIASSTDDLALVMNRFAVGVSNILPEILRGASLTLSMMMFVATLLKNVQLAEVRRIYSSIQDGNDSQKILSNMTWEQFEKIIRLHFELNGYKATLTNTGADGGVDILLQKDGRREMVQCKLWKTSKVGVSVVREIYGVVQANAYERGYIITSGFFTQDAWEFALSANVKGTLSLIDGSRLLKIIKDKEIPPPATEIINVGPGENQIYDLNVIPSCPRCHSKMVRRMSNGNYFYGCSAYPICKGTRNL